MPVVGQWEAICTTDEWEALTSSRIIPRSQSTGLPRAAKYLLSGIARCGVCKSRMRGVRRRVGDKNYDSYICPPRAEGGKQCVARNIAEVDRLVTDTLMEVKLPPAGAASGSAGWDRQAALTSAEARLEGYVQDAARGKIKDSMLYRMLPIIEQEISELQKVKAAWLQSRNQRMLATTTWDAVTWGKLTVNQKRGALSAVILAVEIHPVEGVGRPFDPTKIKIVWRGEVD